MEQTQCGCGPHLSTIGSFGTWPPHHPSTHTAQSAVDLAIEGKDSIYNVRINSQTLQVGVSAASGWDCHKMGQRTKNNSHGQHLEQHGSGWGMVGSVHTLGRREGIVTSHRVIPPPCPTGKIPINRLIPPHSLPAQIQCSHSATHTPSAAGHHLSTMTPSTTFKHPARGPRSCRSLMVHPFSSLCHSAPSPPSLPRIPTILATLTSPHLSPHLSPYPSSTPTSIPHPPHHNNTPTTSHHTHPTKIPNPTHITLLDPPPSRICDHYHPPHPPPILSSSTTTPTISSPPQSQTG